MSKEAECRTRVFISIMKTPEKPGFIRPFGGTEVLFPCSAGMMSERLSRESGPPSSSGKGTPPTQCQWRPNWEHSLSSNKAAMFSPIRAVTGILLKQKIQIRSRPSVHYTQNFQVSIKNPSLYQNQENLLRMRKDSQQMPIPRFTLS